MLKPIIFTIKLVLAVESNKKRALLRPLRGAIRHHLLRTNDKGLKRYQYKNQY